MGFKNLKKVSGMKIAILTDMNRVEVLEKVNKNIKGSNFDTTPTRDSSVGKVVIAGISILAKPASKQDAASAGVGNENMLVDIINKYTKKGGPINVVFKSYNKTYSVNGCASAKSVGAETSGRRKADVVLIDSKGKPYPISIKKDNAETWESADSYFNKEAETIIERAIKEKKTKLVSQGSFFTIEPNIAVKASTKEKEDVVFGSDLKKDGVVITKTFNSQSFNLDKDMNLVVDCSHIITELSDVKEDKDVYFLIRNNKTRNSIKKYPGIRILAVYKKRINNNVIVVQR